MGGSDTKTSTTETVNQRNLSGALPEESKDDSSSPDGWECAMVRRTSTTGTQTTATTTAPEATKMESSTAISNDDSSTEGTPSRVRRQAAKKPKNGMFHSFNLNINSNLKIIADIYNLKL